MEVVKGQAGQSSSEVSQVSNDSGPHWMSGPGGRLGGIVGPGGGPLGAFPARAHRRPKPVDPTPAHFRSRSLGM